MSNIQDWFTMVSIGLLHDSYSVLGLKTYNLEIMDLLQNNEMENRVTVSEAIYNIKALRVLNISNSISYQYCRCGIYDK